MDVMGDPGAGQGYSYYRRRAKLVLLDWCLRMIEITSEEIS